jgi:uncharacterized protein YrrD
MLRKAGSLFGFSLYTKDNEEMGSIHDFYFDREDWSVRYLVADIGAWLMGRRVLIATSALGAPLWENEFLPVDLTKPQVKESPDIDLARPVTRQHEAELTGYYGWPSYWMTPMVAPTAGVAPAIAPAGARDPGLPDEVVEGLRNAEESHVHSMRDTQGYTIEATDDNIGHVDDFFVDDQDWMVRYLLIDTGNWLPGKKVLISPGWVNSVDWHDGRVYVDVPKAKVEASPEYDPSGPLERTYERDLHRHYGYPTYW